MYLILLKIRRNFFHQINSDDYKSFFCFSIGLKAASDKLRIIYKEELIKCLVEQPLSTTGMDSQYVMREDIYIDLIVLPTSTVDKEWNNSDRATLFKQEYLKVNSVAEKAFDQLFFPDDEMIIIRGVAGIGKSTLIDMFTFEWAKKELQCQDFDFVFKFTCREINEIVKEINSVEDLFKRKFPDILEMVSLKDLSELSERILIIVDGLDELKGIYEMEENRDPLTKRERYLQIVYDLIDTKSNNALKNHKTFACGRPKACEFVRRQLSQTNKSKTIEICGFNPGNIRKYIQNFFRNDNLKAEQVIKTIESSSNLKVMSSVPVFLWVICNVYGENLIETKINTNTELYFYTCLIFLRNHLQSPSKKYTNLFEVSSDETIIKIVYSLMILSVKTYMENKVVFTVKDIMEVSSPVHLEKTGFLVKSSSGNTGESMYQFRHLILQEFLCALYLCVTKNISPFLSNRELSSCTPTIHGIHRIIEEGKHYVYVQFYNELKNLHSKKFWFPLRGLNWWGTASKRFQNFISETTLKIPESMITENNILVIDQSDSNCKVFLNIFKETNIQVKACNIHSAEIHLHHYKDYANIMDLLDHLKIKKIDRFLKNYPDDCDNIDLSKLCKMVTGANTLTILNIITYSEYKFRYYPADKIDCSNGQIVIWKNVFSNLNRPYNSDFNGIISEELMENTESFCIGFNICNELYNDQLCSILKYGIQHNKNIEIQEIYDDEDIKRKGVEQLRLFLDRVLKIDASRVKILEPRYIETGRWDHWDFRRRKTGSDSEQ